ncbi:hepatitis A virus cellular receptor 1 homolog isoform X2 [Xyrichtys novacula]|uniref:Hepatitis A virus cellular receptor 1 homolog isoform X2 n=1 Tax=Xyrichtys novacula TaxID=13765 RepID=A0AAV1FR48_XYRNO|nr:hepatitis A virus cellular receptor 1 homolog isoform X2 [Xyrichtys novacula]
MKIALLLVLLTVSPSSSSTSVSGEVGQSVTLPCSYDRQKHGALTVCWGRGDIPNSGCNNQLISTDGNTVTQTSSRFLFLGRLDEGDVSLTILNLTESDSGRYGCRVHILGWFNDDKHHFDLTVLAAQTTSDTTRPRETTTESAHTHSAGQLTSMEKALTSSSSDVKAVTDQEQQGGTETVVLVLVLSSLLALVTAVVVVILMRRWRRLNKMPQQQVSGTVRFSLTRSSLQLHRRESAVENIYQIDGGEYESCP